MESTTSAGALSVFIEHAREKGMDHATIRMLLISSGWKEKDVIEALARTSLELPIPAPPDRGGAREAFFHLLAFAALYASVISAIVLAFQYIDSWFPDPTVTVRTLAHQLSAIRWSLAYLIVSFPMFFLLSRFMLREMRANPERSWSGTRRWLTYLTLFLASLALGGDLIALVFRLLEGELTVRFVGKVLVVLLVAGTAFTYYLLALRMAPARRETVRMHRAFGTGTAAAVVLTVAWGLFVAGSPGTARLQRFDDRRLEDLQTIRSEIQNHCLGNSRFQPLEERELERPLPETLGKVAAVATQRRPEITDPETGEPYVYEPLDETRFRICAKFRFPRDETHEPQWNHRAGRSCFEFDVLRP